MIFLVFAPFAGVHLNLAQVLLVAVVVFLISFALTALGFAIAWPMDSTQAFHGIINLFLIPLWLLSGAMFPISRGLRLDSSADVYEPAYLWSGGVAGSALSGMDTLPFAIGDGDVAAVFAGDVWTCVPDGKPPHHEARRLNCRKPDCRKYDR